MRLWRGQLPRVRTGLDLSLVWSPMEHAPDPRGGVLGDHERDAAVPIAGDGRRDRRGRGVRGAGLLVGSEGMAPGPSRDHVLAPHLHATLASEGPGTGEEPDDMEAASRGGTGGRAMRAHTIRARPETRQGSAARPVMLVTLGVPLDHAAAAFAIDNAVEAGTELFVVNVTALEPLGLSTMLG